MEVFDLWRDRDQSKASSTRMGGDGKRSVSVPRMPYCNDSHIHICILLPRDLHTNK